MHTIDFSGDFNLTLKEISKIEGAASLDIAVRNNKVVDLKFGISEWKRFYTQAIRGKNAMAIPQLVARICGTCSNAHLLASTKAIENAFSVSVTDQTMLLRKLLYYGLIIRDHGLHLYVFSLPDLFEKDSILDFDEHDEREHELLHDTFAVKEVGNQLSIVVGGRSVHAPYPTVGGFLKYPSLDDLKKARVKLEEIRPRVINLIRIFASAPFSFSFSRPFIHSALLSSDFSFLDGNVYTSDGKVFTEEELGAHLKAIIIPYSQARGFTFDGNFMMVGALSRLNMGKEHLHERTKKDGSLGTAFFPSKNLFHNNLAQAIEMLHAVDSACDIIDGLTHIEPEPIPKIKPRVGVGIGVIEAPRGTLYYMLTLTEDGTVKKGEIIVPTGQNQVLMERAIFEYLQKKLDRGVQKQELVDHIEELIRAFDPCMSCAAHFLKVRWMKR